MSILKLANAGDEATLEITGCEIVQGNYGEQIRFQAGEDALFVPKSSADRQLERIGLTYGECEGQTLTFSRTASSKPGSKPYWNINTTKKNGAIKPTAAAPSFANRPEEHLPPLLRGAEAQDNAELSKKIGVDTSKFGASLAVYQALAEWYIQTIVPLLSAGKDPVGCSPDSIARSVNTLFINVAGK